MLTAISTPASPLREASLECRVFERQPCEVPTVCQPASIAEMAEHRWQGVIIDISRGGVRMRLVRRFEKNSALAVEIPGDDVREPYIVFVKVMHVGSDDGQWVLGCKFLSEMSEDETQRLLTATRHVLSAVKQRRESDEA